MILFGLGLWATKGLFVAPTTKALGISRSAYSVSDTMRFIATATVNVFFGTLVNKFGSKKLICAGFVALTVAALLYAVADSVFVFYVGGFILGVGLSWTSTTIVGYVVNKVCAKNRGTIMGFVLAANGIGGAIAAQFISPFINGTDDPFGYRNAYLFMAAITAAVLVVLLLFYREPISSQGEKAPLKKKARGAGWVGIEYNQAIKKSYFYGACVCIFLTGMVLQGITGVYSAHMSDVGLDGAYIATVASAASISLAVFKFLNGFIYDRFGLRTTVTLDCVATVLAVVALCLLTNSPLGMALAIVYAILSGIALPLETVVLPIYANELFGEKSFNNVLGIFVSLNQIGYAVSGPLFGICYDLSGSYKIALIVGGAIMSTVFILLQFVITSAHKVKREVTRQQEKTALL